VAREIPRLPNNKESLVAFEGMSLGSVLIHYTNWAIRYVAPRARKVEVEPVAANDHRWSARQTEITAFLDKVKRGEDLTPHLSLEPHTKGYTPSTTAADRWADKDFLLNVMGYHHFHLGASLEAKGHVKRTDDLIFARVARDSFTVVAIFDHSVFDMERTPSGDMNPERTRLWQVFDEHSARGLPPGSVYIPAMITTSGHSLHLVRLADEYARIVRTIDPKLDDKAYVLDLYDKAGIPRPKNQKLKWHLNLLDLGLLDSSVPVFFVFKYGPG